MQAITTTESHQFQNVCRRWRRYRKMSQLELALAADVSQRHVSWLETGRSQPSRAMVERLSEAMEIPLRERNVLLQAAGFTPAYAETSLEEPAMAPIMEALNRVLAHHEPLPAVVVDRAWNVRLMNRAAGLLLDLVGEPPAAASLDGGASVNLAALSLHPEGLKPHISNWDAAAPALVRRLRSESAAAGDPALAAELDRIIALAGPVGDGVPGGGSLLPVLPLELQVHDTRLSLFSVISTFGTPQDITTDELRIEAFYPSDPGTAEFFRVAGGA